MTELVELTTDDEWDRAVPVRRQLWTDKPPNEVREWRGEERYHLLGLVDDGTLVGVAGVYVQVVLFHERTGWIHDLVVAEDHRSQGYGAELLDAVEAWAADRDCETVGLVCRESNAEARAFYEEHMDRFGDVFQRGFEVGHAD